jgi:hypothetical protein
MPVAPTPEQIAVAELNSWDPQEVADRNAQVARVHELTRQHTKAQLLRKALNGGLVNFNNPAGWTKQELAIVVEEQERRAAQA